MGNDSYYVDPSQNTKEIRHFFVCKTCPLHEQCSKLSWGRVHSRCQDSDRLKEVVKAHLIDSSNHYCEALVNLAMEWEFEEEGKNKVMKAVKDKKNTKAMKAVAVKRNTKATPKH